MSLTPEDLIKRDLDFTNVSKYHQMGYKGKGIIVFNTEDGSTDSSHMRMTNAVLSRVAPDATVVNGRIGATTIQGKTDVYAIIDGKKLDLKETIKKYNIKVMTTSKSGNSNDRVLKYLKECQKELGVIHVCAGGNDGGIGIYVKNNTAIAVAAGYIRDTGEVRPMAYSTPSDEVDFIAPVAGGQGTSASAPFLAGQVIQLLERYGDFTHDEGYEILKSISKDIKYEGWDSSSGWGIPILPLTDKLEILDKLRKNEAPEPVEEGEVAMDFKDIESDRWSKNFIKICTDEGLLQGYPDGTFKPAQPLTREELAVVLVKLLDKIEGRV